MPYEYNPYLESLIGNCLFFVGIGLWIFFAIYFAKAAGKKGRSSRLWFFVCLLIGPIGYACVNSLSDLSYEAKIQQMENRIEQLEALLRKNIQSGNIDNSHAFCVKPETPLQDAADDEWVCSFCDARNKLKYGQCKKCGSYRSK